MTATWGWDNFVFVGSALSQRTQHYDQRWADRGACSGLARRNPRLYDRIFFPEKGRPAAHPDYEKYCSDCPVRAMCYKYAVVNDLDGVWGNTTKAERDLIPDTVRMLIEKEARELGYIEHFAAPSVPRRITVTIITTDEFVELAEEFLGPQDFLFPFEYDEYIQRVEMTIQVYEQSAES